MDDENDDIEEHLQNFLMEEEESQQDLEDLELPDDLSEDSEHEAASASEISDNPRLSAILRCKQSIIPQMYGLR